MLQFKSLLVLTQKKFLPLAERRKTRLSLVCSIIHSGLLSIMLANRFFALFDFGVTKTELVIGLFDYLGNIKGVLP